MSIFRICNYNMWTINDIRSSYNSYSYRNTFFLLRSIYWRKQNLVGRWKWRKTDNIDSTGFLLFWHQKLLPAISTRNVRQENNRWPMIGSYSDRCTPKGYFPLYQILYWLTNSHHISFAKLMHFANCEKKSSLPHITNS